LAFTTLVKMQQVYSKVDEEVTSHCLHSTAKVQATSYKGTSLSVFLCTLNKPEN